MAFQAILQAVIDSRGARAGAREFTRATDQMSNRAQRSLAGIGRGFTAIKNQVLSLRNVVAGLGVALGAAAFINFTRSALETANSLQDTADKLGLTSEKLQELRGALSLSGVSASQADDAIEKLNRAIDDARDGTGPFADRIKELGLNLHNANGTLKDASQLIPELSDAIKNAGTQAERTGIAVDAFGRSGTSLIPPLQGGADAFRDATEAAKDFGLVMAGDIVQKAAIANTTLGALEQGVKTTFEAALLDEFLNSFASVEDVFKEIQPIAKRFGEVVGSSIQGIIDAADFLARNIDAVTTAVKALAAAFLATPFGRITQLFVGLGVVMFDLVTGTSQAEEEARAFTGTLRELNSAAERGLVLADVADQMQLFRDRIGDVRDRLNELGPEIDKVESELRLLNSTSAETQSLNSGMIQDFQDQVIATNDLELRLESLRNEEQALNAERNELLHTNNDLIKQFELNAEAAKITIDNTNDLSNATDDAATSFSMATNAMQAYLGGLIAEHRNSFRSRDELLRLQATREANTAALEDYSNYLRTSALATEQEREQAFQLLKQREADILSRQTERDVIEEINRLKVQRLTDLEREREQLEEIAKQPFIQAIESVGDSFADLFEEIFQGGKDTFQNLSEQIKRIFFRLVGDLARQRLFEPFVNSLFPSLFSQQQSGVPTIRGFTPGLTSSNLGAVVAGLPPGAGSFGLLTQSQGGSFGGGLPPVPISSLFSSASINSFGVGLGFAPGAAVQAGLPAGANLGGSLFGGATLSGTLGAAGAGALFGTLLSGIFPETFDSTGSTLGGGLGAGAGLIVGGPIGAIIGGLLGSTGGGLLGNLLGGRPSVGPNAAANVELGFDANGNPALVVGTAGADNGGSISQAKGLAQGFVDLANNFFSQTGILVNPGGVSLGHFGGSAFSSIGGFPGGAVSRGGGAQVITDLLVELLRRGQIQEGELFPALSEAIDSAGSDLEALVNNINQAITRQAQLQDLFENAATDVFDINNEIQKGAQQFADQTLETIRSLREEAESFAIDSAQVELGLKNAVEALISAEIPLNDEMTETEIRLETLRARFKALDDVVEEVGLSADILETKLAEAEQFLRDEFNENITDSILSITNPLSLALEQFDQLAEDRLQSAEVLGADLLAVEELNALERQRIIEDFNSQANSAIEDFLNNLLGSTSSPLSPTAALANAQTLFSSLATDALGGSAAAREDITGAAGNLIDLARQVFASSSPFFEIFDQVNSVLTQLVNGSPGFQHGGQFLVRGGGGIDSALVAFRATPGELVSISSPTGHDISVVGAIREGAIMNSQGQGEMLAELASLRRDVGEMNVKITNLTRENKRLADKIRVKA